MRGPPTLAVVSLAVVLACGVAAWLALGGSDPVPGAGLPAQRAAPLAPVDTGTAPPLAEGPGLEGSPRPHTRAVVPAEPGGDPSRDPRLGSALGLNYLACEKAEGGDWETAIALLDRGLALDPDSETLAFLRIALCVALLHHGDVRRALDCWVDYVAEFTRVAAPRTDLIPLNGCNILSHYPTREGASKHGFMCGEVLYTAYSYARHRLGVPDFPANNSRDQFQGMIDRLHAVRVEYERQPDADPARVHAATVLEEFLAMNLEMSQTHLVQLPPEERAEAESALLARLTAFVDKYGSDGDPRVRAFADWERSIVRMVSTPR